MSGHSGLMHVMLPKTSTMTTGDDRAWFDCVCGHCGRVISGAVLAYSYKGDLQPIERWIRCPHCGLGIFVAADGTAFPGPKVGQDVEGLPDDVREAYDQARRCAEVNAITACEVMCRKILMHIAVDKGAKSDNTFKGFVNYLEQHHYVTPPMKPWVDVIRDRGNIAAHELPRTEKEQAIGTLTFTAHLLRNVYEMEFLAERFVQTEPDPDAHANS